MSLEDDLHSRAAKLERRISSFRIQNPQGFVTGGFGSLKRGAQDIGERISNIEKSVAGFNLGGDFVEVTGNFKSGFALNAAPGLLDSGAGEAPPPPPSDCGDCPDVDTITVEFSGIVMDCGCVDVLGVDSVIATDIDVNQTFVLTRSVRCPTDDLALSRWDSALIPDVDHQQYWSGVIDCSGDPTTDVDSNGFITVFCSAEFGWQIIYNSESVYIYYVSSFFGSPVLVPTELTCGATIGSNVSGAHNGTVTITW